VDTPKGERLELGLPSGTVVGREVWNYLEVESTNDICKGLAASGAQEGLCVVADSQSKGRGRFGRSWVSPPGVGLYLSCLLRPEIPPESLPLCTLLAGGATARALHEATGANVQLKWPNDLLLHDRKLGGILTELITTLEETPSVVIGIGINVTTPEEFFPQEIRQTATSLLQATGRPFERQPLLKAILLELDAAYAAFKSTGPKAVLDAWRPYAATLGQRVRVEMVNQTLEGEALELTDSGQLIVRTDQGLDVEILAGEVVHLQSGPAA
jgi:BirA family biotin operon repressor/biotin-[acetyl-CoA-carboxylase] ligase